MKINNINNINFNGITKIKISLPDKNNALNEKHIKDVLEVLNAKDSEVYDDSEAYIIKGLHKKHIKDYDGKNAIVRKVKNNFYLITGDDVGAIKAAEKTPMVNGCSKCFYRIDTKSIINAYILSQSKKDGVCVEYANIKTSKNNSQDIRINYINFSHFERV